MAGAGTFRAVRFGAQKQENGLSDCIYVMAASADIPDI
jgi:hypothetical protein